MPLGSNLAADIQALNDTPPASAAAAAAGLAQCYFDYVSGALFGTSIPVITTAHRDAMATTLEAALQVPGLPATAAGGYAAALATFWTAIPCAGASGAGVTDGCPGAGGLVASVSAVLANLANTSASYASGMASALAAATATCTATLTLPPGGPIPYPIG